MMRTSQEGIELVSHYEGFSATPYICAGGYRTIGYGHVILAGESFPQPISTLTAKRLLQSDLRIAEGGVGRLINAPLTQPQFDALVSFTFNLGSGALQRSTLRRKVNSQQHQEVPRELMRWIFAGGRRLRGLVRRRQAEGQMYLNHL